MRSIGRKSLAALAAALAVAAVAARAQKLELVVQTGHSTLVTSVAFSSDGKLLVSGSTDKTVKLWDVASGRELRTLTGHAGEVYSVALAPGDRLLASAGKDGAVKLWDLTGAGEPTTLKEHAGDVFSVAFSPDGQALASGGSDHTVRLRGLGPASQAKTLKGHWAAVTSVAFSPDGKHLASASWDGTIKLWDARDGATARTIMTGDPLFSVAYSPDGRVLASAGQTAVRLWDASTGEAIKIVAVYFSDFGSVRFADGGKVLVGATGGPAVRRWDVATGRELKPLSGHASHVYSLAAGPGGKAVASGSNDNTVKLWDAVAGAELGTLTGLAEEIGTVALSPDGKTLAIGSDDKTVKLLDLTGARRMRALKGHTNYLHSVAFNPAGTLLASGGWDNAVRLWDVASGRELSLLKGAPHTGYVYSVRFSPDGKTVASGSTDGTIKLWDVGGRGVKTVRAHQLGVISAVFSPAGGLLASGGYEETIKLWDAETGAHVATLEGHQGPVNSLAFSPDGRVLASGSQDGTARLWDVAGRRPLGRPLTGHADSVHSVAFSPDGGRLITGSYDNAIKLWDVASGRELHTLLGHSSYIYSIAVGADGKLLVSGSRDKTVRLWNLESLRETAALTALGESEWACLDTEGRFDTSDQQSRESEASGGPLKLMHYIYGLEVIGLEQLKEMYYEPGLLQKLLGYSREALRPIVPLKDVRLHPEVVEQRVEPETNRLTLKLRSRGGGVGRTEVFVNDKLAVADARDARLRANPNVPAGEVVTLTVELPASGLIRGRENQVKVFTSNYLKEIGKGNIQSRDATYEWTPPGEEEFRLPTLYAVVGGVSDYDGERLDLRFAAKDAEDFSAALRLGARRLFCPKENPACIDKVSVTTLSTSGREGTLQPTKENFRRAFADVAARAKPEDILVVYMAGHGVSFGENTDTYFYLTKEARSSSREELTKVLTTSAISSEELTEWLTTREWAPGVRGVRALKQVLILDTCAAGAAAEKLALTAKRELTGDQIRAVEFLKDKTGTFVLMGSTADAPSYEASQYGQGLLTYSLLHGMKGSALDRGEFVDVLTLFRYAQTEVPRLAERYGGVQRPVMATPSGKTFVIGQMTDAEKGLVKLPAPKPLLLRPLLTNPETGDDDLKLIPGLRKLLDAESSYEVMRRSGKGEPVLVYIDDDSFPGAVRVTGSYAAEGDKVRVKAYLRRDGQTVAALPELLAARESVLNDLMSSIRAELEKIR